MFTAAPPLGKQLMGNVDKWPVAVCGNIVKLFKDGRQTFCVAVFDKSVSQMEADTFKSGCC